LKHADENVIDSSSMTEKTGDAKPGADHQKSCHKKLAIDQLPE
jgi:hypothetical protein